MFDEEEAERQHRLREATQKRFAEQAAQRRAEEAARDAVPLLPAEKEIATQLHELLCHYNHADGCGWHYADPTDYEWNREFSHVKYLTMTRFMLEHEVNTDEVIKFLRLTAEAKALK